MPDLDIIRGASGMSASLKPLGERPTDRSGVIVPD
jgi:hypothetical protein